MQPPQICRGMRQKKKGGGAPAAPSPLSLSPSLPPPPKPSPGLGDAAAGRMLPSPTSSSSEHPDKGSPPSLSYTPRVAPPLPWGGRRGEARPPLGTLGEGKGRGRGTQRTTTDTPNPVLFRDGSLEAALNERGGECGCVLC